MKRVDFAEGDRSKRDVSEGAHQLLLSSWFSFALLIGLTIVLTCSNCTPSAKPYISHTKPSHRALITGEMNEKGRFLPKAL
jgi:hypothetical protein